LPECPFISFLSPKVIHGTTPEKEQMMREVFQNSSDKECEEENKNAHCPEVIGTGLWKG